MLNLKAIRKEQGVSCEDISKAVGITQQYLNYIENGHRRPSVRVAKAIAQFLGFEWTAFYEEETPKEGVSEGEEEKN